MILKYCDTLTQELQTLEQTQSFDEDQKEEEMAEEETEDFSGREIASELVEFPQPRWSKRMAASE